jgi:hypothetical protein
MMPYAPQIDDPQTLIGLFPPDSDDDEEGCEHSDNGRIHNDNNSGYCYEVQSVDLAGKNLKVRQYDYHSHNANRVWPGTFPLADYLFATVEKVTNIDLTSHNSSSATLPIYKHNWGRVLELGTATGLLAIRFALACSDYNTGLSSEESCCCSSIVTSDVDDELGDIFTNLQYNYELNDLILPYPKHVSHTWGTGWTESARKATSSYDDNISDTVSTSETSNLDPSCFSFDTIVASDILLYVSAYPALVSTLCELMIPDHSISLLKPRKPVFVMSWNRRLKESNEFFTRMEDAGFVYERHGKGLYTFVYKHSNFNNI